jgi:hypothetical protein
MGKIKKDGKTVIFSKKVGRFKRHVLKIEQATGK